MWTQIPPTDPIRDPLSKYWGQPKPEKILVDQQYAIMTVKTFKELKDYSFSQPTGAYIGKMWRCQEHERITTDKGVVARPTGRWTLCWFGPSPDPGYVSNNYRTILLI